MRYVRFFDDFRVYPFNNVWEDTVVSGFGDPKVYVVQTVGKVIERCLLMASDPGDRADLHDLRVSTTATVAGNGSPLDRD